MKLRNRKTGEIGKLHCDMNVSPAKYGVFEDSDIRGHYWEYNSLAELNEEWEDYEEPKEYWFIAGRGVVEHVLDTDDENDPFDKGHKEMGNYFKTKEEAEKAVEKLKAWKRLKDKGFEFTGFTHKDRGRLDELEIYCQLGERPEDIEDMKDVRLLFGGEE